VGLHWLQVASFVAQFVIAVAVVVLLTMKGGDEALVGSPRVARWATAIVVLIICTLALLTTCVDDEGALFGGPPPPHVSP